MNLYFIQYLIPDGSGDNLDWHVVAETAGEARQLWAEELSGWQDDPILPAMAQRVSVVLFNVGGEPRLVEWLDADDEGESLIYATGEA